jgi:hypothetical protein
VSQPEAPSEADRAWIDANQRLWQRAQEIVAKQPDLDVNGVFRALRNLRKTPGQRLRDALRHGRLFGLHGR